ncbi:Dephospho-CoA kinase [Chlamydiales bacterium SCGC AG-110-M15]|nr:Dephospho-CoA kinase [Chlamydiales bacterium SCGC AG-110-M15]
MLKLRKLAVTGGLASGKSSVCKFFSECGAHVVSTDSMVHQLLSPSTDIGKQVIDLLGKDIVIDGQIERRRIAKKVFEDPALLKDLERILHPAVRLLVEGEYQGCKNREDISLFVVEIPLLFESGVKSFSSFFDWTVSVSAGRELCEERFLKIRGHNLEQFQKRSLRQLPQNEKDMMADYVIYNHASKEELKEAVFRLHQDLVRSGRPES